MYPRCPYRDWQPLPKNTKKRVKNVPLTTSPRDICGSPGRQRKLSDKQRNNQRNKQQTQSAASLAPAPPCSQASKPESTIGWCRATLAVPSAFALIFAITFVTKTLLFSTQASALAFRPWQWCFDGGGRTTTQVRPLKASLKEEDVELSSRGRYRHQLVLTGTWGASESRNHST